MLIRPIELRDASRYLTLMKKLDEETKFMLYEPGERRTTIKKMEERIKNILDSGSMLFIAEEQNELIGFIAVNRKLLNRIKHIGYIVIGILEDHTGKGLGAKLFQKAEEWAKTKDMTRLELTVMTHNNRAVKLYEKMGFEIEGRKRKACRVEGQYIDEYYMGKLIE